MKPGRRFIEQANIVSCQSEAHLDGAHLDGAHLYGAHLDGAAGQIRTVGLSITNGVLYP